MDGFPYPVLVEGDWSSINAKTLQSKVQIYFQSRKKSHGGDCVISWSERSCTVFFKSEEIRDQVLAKADHTVTIEKQELKLKVSKPSSDSGSRTDNKSQASAKSGSDESAGGQQTVDASQKGPEGLEDTSWSSAVVLENVPEDVSEEFLVLLVGTFTSQPEEEWSIEFISESNAAVVTFNDPSAVENFLTECRTKKKFQDYGYKARRLEKSRSVKVENLPAQCHDQLLELYFEKHVGAVEGIEVIADEQVAMVTFEDHQDIPNAIGKKHVIRNTPLNIYPYFPSLGSVLYGKDRPKWTLPKPFTYKIHPAIRQFLQKKGLISSICDQMSSRFCQVKIDKDEVLCSPLPALLRQKGLTKKHIANWKEDTTDAFKNILSNFGVFEHSVLPSVWTAVEKDIRSVVKDKAVLEVDFSTGCLTLAGMAKDIDMLKPILETHLKNALSQIEREKMKTSDIIIMPPAIFYLFQQEGLQTNASAKYPQLELTYRKDKNQLQLTGLHMEIIEIKNFILEKRFNMKEKTLKLDSSLLKFLSSVDCEQMSRDLFTSKDIKAVYRFENGETVLTASTDNSLADAEKRLQMMLTLQRLPVEDLTVLEKPDWQDLTKQLNELYNSSRKTTVLIKSSEHRNTVEVCGFQEPVREVSKSLEQFINKHSRIEESIRVNCYAVVKFIREKKPQVWQNFLKGDELNIHFDSKRPLIRVSGERVHVQPALMAFQNITKSLHTDKLTISKAGVKKYFQEQGYMVFMMLKDHRFVVVLEDDSMREEFEESYPEEIYGAGTVKDSGQLFCEVQTPGGIVIKVQKADICQLKVDAVVNAANEDLQHIGGLALALLNAAGSSLQQSSDRYIAKHGKLGTGNAITTEAGHLPCKYVVHAVGPRFYNTDRFTAVKQLRQAVRESLNQAILNRCSSIAVPAISSGIFGFPLDLCTETIAKELHAFIDLQIRQGGMNTLKEIHLVNNNQTTVDAMTQAVKKEFTDFNPIMTFSQQMGHGHGHHGQKDQGDGNRGQGSRGQDAGRRHGNWERGNGSRIYRAKDSEEFGTQGQPYSMPQVRTQFEEMNKSGSGFLEAQSTKEGLKIILRKGNIQDARSDVIVNTISEDLDLRKGAVSKALLDAAGSQLQSEINSHKKFGLSRLNYGDLVDTNSYNLKCQRVFHTVCPFWSGGNNSEAEVLKGIIKTCLKKAEDLKMSSISFPAIGTGNLCFPVDLVSRLLLSEIHAFSASVSPQFLKEVTVIVHPSASETVQCFVKSFRGERQGSVTTRTHAVQQSRAKETPPVRSQQSAAGHIGMVSTPSLGVHKMQIKHLSLEVSSGDITKERCDAIINSSNATFSLKSGVSKAILDAAGLTVEMECKQIVPVASQSQQADMIMTSGGQLPCKHIVHVVGRNDPAVIKNVVYSVLKFCEEKKFTSVAFPALGTGQGGVQPSAVADAMIEALIDFVKKKKGTHLQSVKFLIFQPSMVSDFHKTMLKKQQECPDEEGGFIGWVKGTVDTFASYFKSPKSEASANEEFVLVGEEFEPVVFQLCGESQEDLNEARNLITSFIVKEHMSSNIQDSAISNFSQEEADVLSNLQRELTVSIQLSKSGPEPVLTVEGLTRDVVKAECQIRDLIRKVEKNMTRQREAFLLMSQVEWQYQDSGKFVPCDILTNYDLEQALLFKRPRLTIKINNDPYEANLATGTATGKHGQIELARIDLKQQTSVSLPSHWEDMKGKLVLRVEIQQGSQEYTDVETSFRRTGLTSTILKIERIQNETLWKNYMNQKAYLEKKNNHTNNEKLLFHGTGSDNIDKINDRGFNRSYAGMNGAMYGNGVYFAVDPCYSARGYARPDPNGDKRMYLARVLVGDFTRGKAGLLTPPTKNSTSTDQYDSVTDPSQTMFVIFHDVNAYPEYLITFQ